MRLPEPASVVAIRYMPSDASVCRKISLSPNFRWSGLFAHFANGRCDNQARCRGLPKDVPRRDCAKIPLLLAEGMTRSKTLAILGIVLVGAEGRLPIISAEAEQTTGFAPQQYDLRGPNPFHWEKRKQSNGLALPQTEAEIEDAFTLGWRPDEDGLRPKKVRLDLPIGPVRIDYGIRNLFDVPMEQRQIPSSDPFRYRFEA